MFLLMIFAPHWNILGVLAAVPQETKIWTQNTNYDNPRNWASGRLPCSKDRVIFPSDARIVAFMPEVVSFSDMVLPLDAEIVLQKNTKFFDGNAEEEFCKGRDVLFVVHADTWYDPRNWNVSSSNTYPREVPTTNRVVPDAYTVPCPTDHLIFPEGTSFKVHMESTSLTVASISINGVNYDNEELKVLLASHTGQLLFAGSPRITVTGQGCTDVTGCACGNDDPRIMKKICSQMRCPPFRCHNPIEAVGRCCPSCGAYLSIQYEEGFDLKQFSSFIESHLGKEKYSSVESYTSKTRFNDIQSVFAGDNIGLVMEAAQMIHDELIQDLQKANQNKIRSVKLIKSGERNDKLPDQSLYSSRGLSSGGVAIIVVIIALAGFAAVVWYIYRKRKIPGFSFARFDFHSSKVELELGTTPHEDLDPEDSLTPAASAAMPKAFDNPVYDTIKERKGNKLKEEALMENIEESEEVDDQENVVENPMFMVFSSTESEKS